MSKQLMFFYLFLVFSVQSAIYEDATDKYVMYCRSGPYYRFLKSDGYLDFCKQEELNETYKHLLAQLPEELSDCLDETSLKIKRSGETLSLKETRSLKLMFINKEINRLKNSFVKTIEEIIDQKSKSNLVDEISRYEELLVAVLNAHSSPQFKSLNDDLLYHDLRDNYDLLKDKLIHLLQIKETIN